MPLLPGYSTTAAAGLKTLWHDGHCVTVQSAEASDEILADIAARHAARTAAAVDPAPQHDGLVDAAEIARRLALARRIVHGQLSKARSNGLFVSLEGPEGAGKTTQAVLLADYLQRHGHDVLSLREPGGTLLSEKIRSILLDPSHTALTPRCETLLFAAARAQLASEVIEPALAHGRYVVCDRYIDSSIAYQGVGRELGVELVRAVNEAATGGFYPDLTLLLDLDPELGLARAVRRHRMVDRMENEPLAFHTRVRDAFLALAKTAPARMRIIDASQPLEAVHRQIIEAVEALPSRQVIQEKPA